MVSARKRWRLVAGEGEQRDLLAREAGISPRCPDFNESGYKHASAGTGVLAPSLENTMIPICLRTWKGP